MTREFMRAVLSGYNDIEQMGVFAIEKGEEERETLLRLFGTENLAPSLPLGEGDYIYSYTRRICAPDCREVRERATLSLKGGERTETIYIYNLN